MQTSKKSRIRKGLTVTLKGLAALILLTVILISGTWALLQTDPIRNYATSMILAAVEEKYSVQIEIEKVTGNLIRNISVKNLRVVGNDGPILQVNGISIDYLVSDLFDKVLMVRALKIDGGELSLKRSSDGSWNIPILGQETQTWTAKSNTKNFAYIIDQIEVINSGVKFTDFAVARPTIRNLTNIHLSGKIKAEEKIVIRITDCSFNREPELISLSNMEGAMVYDPKAGHLSAEQIIIKTDASQVGIMGEVTGLRARMPDMNLQVDLDSLSVEEISSFLDLKEIKKGCITGSLHLKGTLQKVHHDLTLQWDRLKLATIGSLEKTENGELAADISVKIKHLNPLDFLSSKVSRLDGDINVDLKLKGTNLLGPERQASVTGDIKNSQLSNFRLNNGTLSAAISGDKVTVSECMLNAACGRLTGTGEFGGFFDGSLVNRAKLKAVIGDFDVSCMGLRVREGLVGTIDAELDLTVELPSLNLNDAFSSLKIVFEPFSISGIPIDKAELEATWDRRELAIQNFVINNRMLGTLALNGTLNPERKASNIHGVLQIPNVTNAVSLIEKEVPSLDSFTSEYPICGGSLQATAAISGWLNQFNIDTETVVTSFSYDNLRAKILRLNGTWAGLPEDVTGTAELQSEEFSIGNHHFPRLAVKMNHADVDAAFHARTSYNSGIDILISGSISDWLSPTKKITMNDLQFHCDGPTLVNLTPINLLLSPETVDVESFNLASNEGTLRASGSLERSGRGSVTFDIDTMDLRYLSWFRLFDEPISGSISACGEVGGWWDRPTFSAVIKGEECRYKNLSSESVKAKATWGGSLRKDAAELEVIADNISIESEKAGLTEILLSRSELDTRDVKRSNFNDQMAQRHDANTLPATSSGMKSTRARKLEPSGNTRGLHISRLITDATIDPGLIRVGMEVEVDDDKKLELDGQIGNWTETPKQIRLNSLLWETEAYRSINRSPISIALSSDGVDINPVDMLLGDVELSFGGKILRSGDSNLSLTLKNLDLAQLSSFLPRKNHMKGKATAEIEILGNLSTPIIAGRIALNDAAINEQLISKSNLELDYNDGKFDLSGMATFKDKEIMRLDGAAHLPLSLYPLDFSLKNSELDVNVTAQNVNLGIFPIGNQANFLTGGKLTIDAHIHGDLMAPTITGRFFVKEGFLNLKDPKITYEGLTADCTLLPGKITIDKLDLRGDREGELNCSGDVVYEGANLQEFNLKLTGNNVHVPFQKAIYARVQPDLILSGTLTSPELSGTILVNDSRINLDRLASRGLAEIRVVNNTSEAKSNSISIKARPMEESFLGPLSASVVLDIPGNAWIKDRDMSVEINGILNLEKEAEKRFTLVGALKSVRGNYSTRGKLFKVTKGTISFIGLEEPNPNLDIVAVTRIDKNDIIIRIGGTAKDIKISFDSEPAMSHSDIISYLVFGKPIDSLEGQQAFNSQLAALSLTGSVAAEELRRVVGDVFFFDTVAIDAGGKDLRSGLVSFGKYIAPEIFVTYQQGFTSDEPRQVKVNYEINRNVSIETQIGDEKTNGVDLIWKYDY